MPNCNATPAAVREMGSPTKGAAADIVVRPMSVQRSTLPIPTANSRAEYMCKLSEGRNLDFLEFEIRDGTSNTQFYRIEREAESVEFIDYAPEVEDLIRHVRYMLPTAMLRSRHIRTRLKFAVGDSQVQELLLIERHYFKGKLVRHYEHTFGPCTAGSTHVWEVGYDMPQYSTEEITEFVENPDEHTSDSFYFANGGLVVHNKASFTYFDSDLSTEAHRGTDEAQLASGILTGPGGALPCDACALRVQPTGGAAEGGPDARSCAEEPTGLPPQVTKEGCERSGKDGGTGCEPDVATAADALAAKLHHMA